MSNPRAILHAAEKTDEALGKIISSGQNELRAAITRLERRIVDGFKELSTNGKGLLVGPRVNLKQAQKMHKDLVNIFEEEYGKGARRAVNGFNDVEAQIKANFKSLDVAAEFTGVDRDIIKTLESQALLEFEQFGRAAQEKIATAMYDAVVAKGGWADLVATMNGVLQGGTAANGLSLAAYSTTWANDAIMNFHQQVALKKASDAGLTMFLYYGNIIGTSRPFCIDRAGKVFSRQEIDSWNDLSWAGKRGPAMTYRGGWNCRHHWQPVKKDWLPEGGIEIADYFEEKGIAVKRGTTIPAWPGKNGNKGGVRVGKPKGNPSADPDLRWVPDEDDDNGRAWCDQIFTHCQAYTNTSGLGACGPVADNIVDLLQAQGRKARVMYCDFRTLEATTPSDIFGHYVAVELDEADNVIRIWDPTNPYARKKPILNIYPGNKPAQYWNGKFKDAIEDARVDTEIFTAAGRSGDDGLYGAGDLKWWNDKMGNPQIAKEAAIEAGEAEFNEALKKVRKAGTATEIEMGVGYVDTNVPLDALDTAKVEAIKKSILAGDKFNPIVILGEADDPRVLDGLHRMRAYLELYGPEHKVKFITTDRIYYNVLQGRERPLLKYTKIYGKPEVKDLFETGLAKYTDEEGYFIVSDAKIFGTVEKDLNLLDEIDKIRGSFTEDELASVSGMKKTPWNRMRGAFKTLKDERIRLYKDVDFGDAETYWEQLKIIKYKGKLYVMDARSAYRVAAGRLKETASFYTNVVDLDELIARKASFGKDIVYAPSKTKGDAVANLSKTVNKSLNDSPYGYVKSHDQYTWRFSHNDWPGFSYTMPTKDKTALIHGMVRVEGEMTHETLEGVHYKFVELQNRAKRLGLPPLRAVNAKDAVNMSKASVAASMGDGVLTLNAHSMNADLGGFVIDKVAYRKTCDKFVSMGEKVLPAIEKQFGKTSAEARVLKEQIALRKDELKKLKDNTWEGPAFGGQNRRVNKWRPGTKGTGTVTKKGGSITFQLDNRPFTCEQYFDNAWEQGYTTMDHEFGHHIHQQLLVDTWYEQNKPPLEQWLKKHMPNTDLDRQATRYAISRDDYGNLQPHEWFAENYALWANGKKGLVDPYLHGLMESLDDLMANKITKDELKARLMTPKGTIRSTPIKAKGTYASKVVGYSRNDLLVLRAMAQKPSGVSLDDLGKLIDSDVWQGNWGWTEIDNVVKKLKREGLIRSPANDRFVLAGKA